MTNGTSSIHWKHYHTTLGIQQEDIFCIFRERTELNQRIIKDTEGPDLYRMVGRVPTSTTELAEVEESYEEMF